MANKNLFKNFEEYWYFAKYLTEEQRDIIFNSLDEMEQDKIQKSFLREGWKDVFMRNNIDALLDYIRHEYGVDLLAIKTKVNSGKSHFMNEKKWNLVKECFKEYEDEYIAFLFGGVTEEKVDENTILLYQ